MLNDGECRCTCPGATVWVTGRSLADRRAAAYTMAERLTAEGRRVQVLDKPVATGEDTVRTGITAEVLARNGLVAIVPCTTDAARDTAGVRTRHAASGTRYVEVCVAEAQCPEDSAALAHERLTGRR
ncbi:hypothetical protein ACIRBZ_40045 [Streptomyces sp. NPDC094038]|uniref:hypothetical protein n=1 Tax=Streptomyces sp. NPDC094038 TaxID=3366055 RepID=UPI0038196852